MEAAYAGGIFGLSCFPLALLKDTPSPYWLRYALLRSHLWLLHTLTRECLLSAKVCKHIGWRMTILLVADEDLAGLDSSF